MKLYAAVVYEHCEGSRCIGIYSTEELAQEALRAEIAALKADWDVPFEQIAADFYVKEVTVDCPCNLNQI